MSYTIEYKRQFIKSQEGITPCWLAGDNNVYEKTFSGKERRSREWCCFHNFVGVTKKDILDSVQASLGGYEEHWMRNGKWVDDKGLIRWIESGCKSAATVDDILDANPHLRDILCYVSVWEGSNYRVELDYFISSTAEFDRWIRMFRALRDKLVAKGCSVYPTIKLGSEDLFRQPRLKKDSLDGYLLKKKGMYLTSVAEFSVTWDKDVKKALVLTYDEITALWAKHLGLRKASPVSAKVKDGDYNAVIMFADGFYCRQYVAERVKGHLRLTLSIDDAKRYPTEKAAAAAIKKMQPKYAKYGNLVVKIYNKGN